MSELANFWAGAIAATLLNAVVVIGAYLFGYDRGVKRRSS